MIQDYINNPKSYRANYDLAKKYKNQGQLASATTHFLKAADNASTTSDVATCLYLTATCFKEAGGRQSTTENLLKRAISVDEFCVNAYIELAEMYIARRAWLDAYMIASLGHGCTFSYTLKLLQGISVWWLGDLEGSRFLITQAWIKRDQLPDKYRELAETNVKIIGHDNIYFGYAQYHHENLKRKFPGSEQIARNYAQSYQDMFALLVSKGKHGGTYLEIGSGDPIKRNNTYLLEKDFGWNGISVEQDFGAVQKFNLIRRNSVLQANALEVDYATLGLPSVVDYLQIDCDPPEVSFAILQKIPFDKIKFNAITFEHDFYADPRFRDKSREYLKSKGYKLVVSDVAFTEGCSFEDWWVHDSVPFASPNVANDGLIKTGRSYMLDLP